MRDIFSWRFGWAWLAGVTLSGLSGCGSGERQPEDLRQDPQRRWLVTHQVTLRDGKLAIVVTRLRGDSQ